MIDLKRKITILIIMLKIGKEIINIVVRNFIKKRMNLKTFAILFEKNL